jgi:hypothetical protein
MYSHENSSSALMARMAMLGIVFLAAVSLASAAHPQTYSEDIARRMLERPDLAYERARDFERMFQLYEVPAAGNIWQDVPAEGRAVKPADER